MSHFSLDFETTSVCDITLGSYRYACDPSTRILMFAIAKDKGEPFLWRFDQRDIEGIKALSLLRDAVSERAPIYAHNAQFEAAICKYRIAEDTGCVDTVPALEQWRCTLAMCRRAAAPESLGQAAEFFGLDVRKDTVGKALIGVFSDQTKLVTLRNGKESRKSASPILETPVPWDWTMTVGGETMTVREAWGKFCGYCKTDVRVEQELHRKLERFELKGDVLASFQFDFRMNDRGVPVNMDALGNAERIVSEYRDKLEARLQSICGLSSGQREKLLNWLRERGYMGEDLTAGTVEKVLAEPGAMLAEAVEVLRLRSMLSFAALKKIPTMLNSACPDARIRGTTQWHSARTGRSGGRIIQPQNFKKSTIEHSELCYRMIQEGWPLSDFEELWNSPLEAIASSIRHFIQPADGRLLLDADYTGVEARISPWICGQTDKLQSILDGKDQYKVMASEVIFHVPYDKVTKEQRTVGKPVELMCGFGTGGRGLRNSLRDIFGINKELKECNTIVASFRSTFPKYEEAWHSIEDAAKGAIRNPGRKFPACDDRLSFTCGRAAGINYLMMRLPSGRPLYYPHPRVESAYRPYDEEEMEEDPWKREKKGYYIDQISFYGKKLESVQWVRVTTWGSRLFENAVQATGADLLNYGMIRAEAAGYEIFMPVHDQALAEDNGLPLEGYIAALCEKQPWARTFPLAATGFKCPYYLKD